MDLPEEYLNNIKSMNRPVDDYGDRKNVRKRGRPADRNRKALWSGRRRMRAETILVKHKEVFL